MFRVIALALACALPANAQTYGPTLASDLNGDGAPEQFRLTDFQNDGIVDLEIISSNGNVTIAKDIAWRGGIGQEPTLALAPNGSLLVISMNESIGRNRWRQTLTIAYRKNAYRVAGFTYEWYDTLDPEDYGSCDLNLLSGSGNLQIADRPLKRVRTNQRAISVAQWKDDHPIPKVCGF